MCIWLYTVAYSRRYSSTFTQIIYKCGWLSSMATFPRWKPPAWMISKAQPKIPTEVKNKPRVTVKGRNWLLELADKSLSLFISVSNSNHSVWHETLFPCQGTMEEAPAQTNKGIVFQITRWYSTALLGKCSWTDETKVEVFGKNMQHRITKWNHHNS